MSTLCVHIDQTIDKGESQMPRNVKRRKSMQEVHTTKATSVTLNYETKTKALQARRHQLNTTKTKRIIRIQKLKPVLATSIKIWIQKIVAPVMIRYQQRQWILTKNAMVVVFVKRGVSFSKSNCPIVKDNINA